MINHRPRAGIVFWRAVAEGATWGVGVGAAYAIGCASLALISGQPTSISDVGVAMMYLALYAVTLAAYGGALGLIAGLTAGIVVGVALAVTTRVQAAGREVVPHATLTQRIVGAIGGASAVALLGAWLAAWLVAWTTDSAPRGVDPVVAHGDRLIVVLVFVVGPSIITAAVCAWRTQAILRSGVRDTALGTPAQRRRAVERIDNAPASDR